MEKDGISGLSKVSATTWRGLLADEKEVGIVLPRVGFFRPTLECVCVGGGVILTPLNFGKFWEICIIMVLCQLINPLEVKQDRGQYPKSSRAVNHGCCVSGGAFLA